MSSQQEPKDNSTAWEPKHSAERPDPPDCPPQILPTPKAQSSVYPPTRGAAQSADSVEGNNYLRHLGETTRWVRQSGEDEYPCCSR